MIAMSVMSMPTMIDIGMLTIMRAMACAFTRWTLREAKADFAGGPSWRFATKTPCSRQGRI